MWYVLLLLTIMVILNRIPVVGKILKGVSTMFHEFGHALMALLTGGKVDSIQLMSNNAGLANVRVYKGFSTFLMSIAGYPAEIGAAYLILWMYVSDMYLLLIIILASVTLFTFLFIRNIYGFFWLLVFGGFLYVSYMHIESLWVSYAFLIIVLSTLGEALYASFTICVLSMRRRKEAGDATYLAEKTGVPAPVWGVFFFLLSSYVFYQSLDLLGQLTVKNPF